MGDSNNNNSNNKCNNDCFNCIYDDCILELNEVSAENVVTGAYKSKYYEEHREEIRQKLKIYYQNNKDKFRANQHKWRTEHPTYNRDKQREYRARKKERTNGNKEND